MEVPLPLPPLDPPPMGFTDSDSDGSEDNTHGNTSLCPAEWPKSPAQTLQPLAELELVTLQKKWKRPNWPLKLPCPTLGPPLTSQILEDIAQTPTPQ